MVSYSKKGKKIICLLKQNNLNFPKIYQKGYLWGKILSIEDDILVKSIEISNIPNDTL